jgi:NDP-sugar pyrophosphorylase family protein
MQAVILAGGKGTRLRPFTTSLPKPLVPVGDLPIIDIVLRQLRHHGFREVVLSTGHLAELIMAYCGNGKKWKLRIRYVREDKPLSAAGALKLIRGLGPEFMTINGDVLTDLDFGNLVRHHRRNRATASVAVCERQTVVNFGTIHLDGDDRIQAYVEKPSLRYLVSMGVNVFSRKAVDFIRPGEALGIPELIGRLRAAGQTVVGFRNQAAWLDIGRPEDYQEAQEIFSDPKRRRRYLKS